MNVVATETDRTPGALIFRCDASVMMGTGHAMRCLALGQAWQDIRGAVVFAMGEVTPAIGHRIKTEKMGVVRIASGPATLQDAEELVRIAAIHSAQWVVVDGYKFGVEYQRALKEAGLKLLLVDDSAVSTECIADLILNQYPYAREEFYPCSKYGTRLLLGLRFAMLRREFAPWKKWEREILPSANKVLVTMGGSDPSNVTLDVIEALSLMKQGLEVAVVIGGSNPHIRSLETAAANFSGSLRMVKNVSLPEFMAWADLAISSSGTTSAEICRFGLPAILVDIAPNQTPVARELSRMGAAVHKSIAEVQDHEKFANCVRDILEAAESRAAMSRVAHALVDGRGAERVVAAIQGPELRLRPAEEKDCKLLWEWANDPEVRAASFCQDFIPWEQHVSWFQSRLRDQNTRIMMAMNSHQVEIGTVRFNLKGNRAVVSISLDQRARGKGQGSAILRMAVNELFRSSDAIAVDAYVKPHNEASQKLFEKTSFQRFSSMEIVLGEQAIHFTLSKNGAS